jgi:hypothetical protein
MRGSLARLDGEMALLGIAAPVGISRAGAALKFTIMLLKMLAFGIWI